jgi:hypothetical protein
MKRVILVVCDGLWAGELKDPSCEWILRFARKGRLFADHRGIAPSVTRASAASIVTGSSPAEHGLYGNRVIMPKAGGGLETRDVGEPSFFPHAKALLGRVLNRPSLPELIAPAAFLACSNVSPGAAYMLDTEHMGWVYHRAGSFGPGGRALPEAEGLNLSKGPEGDALMAERFIAEHRRIDPSLAILWLGEPDTSLHLYPPGSEGSRVGYESAAQSFARIEAFADELASGGDDVLLLLGSDHGMEPADRLASVGATLSSAGYNEGFAIASNGGSALLAVEGGDPRLVASLVDALKDQEWAGAVYAEHGKADGPLSTVGLKQGPCLSIFIDAAYTGRLSPVSGRPTRWMLAEGKAPGDIPEIGCHGYAGGPSLEPFLVASGPSFEAGTIEGSPSSIMDIAPTILRHLGIHLPARMEAKALQDSSEGGES